jgi:hypothetical protein
MSSIQYTLPSSIESASIYEVAYRRQRLNSAAAAAAAAIETEQEILLDGDSITITLHRYSRGGAIIWWPETI